MHNLALQNADWQTHEVHYQLSAGTLCRIGSGVSIVDKCENVEVGLCIFPNCQEPLQEPDERSQVVP